MNQERREHERVNLTNENSSNLFFILSDDEKQAFDQVFDISISGMGVNIDAMYQSGQLIKVKYESDESNISIDANVAWRLPIDSNINRYGIQFSKENMNHNVAIFNAFKQFLETDD